MNLSESKIKSELRKKYKCLRNDFTHSINKSEADEQICRHIVNSRIFSKTDTVLLYASIESEVDLSFLHSASKAAGKRIAYPKVISKGEMEFYYVDSYDDMAVGAYGIKEPRAECEYIALSELHSPIIVVPALCFEKSGKRLGYGGGYYDRLLSRFTGISVGVSYTVCIADRLVTEQHDICVDHVVTQDGFIK